MAWEVESVKASIESSVSDEAGLDSAREPAFCTRSDDLKKKKKITVPTS